MKYYLALLAFIAAAFVTAPAQAGNSTIEAALKSRDDLSLFYEGLVNTGVINELKEGQSYTVFAPTNDAFAKLPLDQYPCFYSAACKAQVATILRNHIVPGEKHLSDISQNAGVMSMFTIGDYHLIGSEPSKDTFAVDGHKVLSENQLLGSMLYCVDGLLATPREMAQFGPVALVYAHNGLPPRIADGTIVTVTTPDLSPSR